MYGAQPRADEEETHILARLSRRGFRDMFRAVVERSRCANSRLQ